MNYESSLYRHFHVYWIIYNQTEISSKREESKSKNTLEPKTRKDKIFRKNKTLKKQYLLSHYFVKTKLS